MVIFLYIFCVLEHAKQWIGCLGKLLRDSAKDNLFQLNDNLDVSTVIICKSKSNLKVKILTSIKPTEADILNI